MAHDRVWIVVLSRRLAAFLAIGKDKQDGWQNAYADFILPDR
jgi:hypothetical protein